MAGKVTKMGYHDNFPVRGYKEEGITTMPFVMRKGLHCSVPDNSKLGE